MPFYVDPGGGAVSTEMLNSGISSRQASSYLRRQANPHLVMSELQVSSGLSRSAAADYLSPRAVQGPIQRMAGPRLGTRLGSAWSTWKGTGWHKAGMEFAKWDLGFGAAKKAGLLRFLGPMFLGVSAYQGYQEGGIVGAGAAVGKHLAASYVIGAALSMAKLPLLGAAGVGLMGLGLFKLGGGNVMQMAARPWVREHMKRHQKLEMGTPVVDNYGTVSTMRQRSLAAIQNSHINGRTALGSEAALLYTPY